MKLTAALALALVASPLAASAASDHMLPGYWQVTTDWLGLVKTTERYCIDAKKIDQLMLGPCNHHYRCTYPVQTISDGKADFAGEISARDELYHVHGEALFSPTTLDMHMEGYGHWHLLPIPAASASIRAHMLAETCPAGAKRL